MEKINKNIENPINPNNGEVNENMHLNQNMQTNHDGQMGYMEQFSIELQGHDTFYMNTDQENAPQELKDWEKFIPTGNRELLFGLIIILFSLFMANCRLYGGFNLGFAVAALFTVCSSVIYLKVCGYKGNWYSWTLIALCLLIIPGFARSDDEFVKRVMLCFLFVGINLSLTIQTDKNRRDTSGVHSLLDPFHTAISLGLGESPKTIRGIKKAFQSGSTAVKSGGAVMLGLVIAIPIIVIMIPLLMQADAAFEGLLDLLPDFDFVELVTTVALGGFLGCWFYSRTVVLNHCEKSEADKTVKKFFSAITMNTVLGAVCLVYVVYLISQLAYFFGGFAGILPEGYSMAEYARRGFFEMAWLCLLNLSVIILGISKTARKEEQTPLASRIMCLFIGIITLFLVVTAGAKMMMYIGDYGMTRLRVLTMVIMAFLGLTTALVSIWLFVPKLPYMKAVILSALVIGLAVFWIDVDSQVAKYNVESYFSGKHKELDMSYLARLGSGAIPYISRVAEEAPEGDAKMIAKDILKYRSGSYEDIRSWNYVDHVEKEYLENEN